MGTAEVTQFLTHLAKEQVSTSSQKQAMSANRVVLQELEGIDAICAQ